MIRIFERDVVELQGRASRLSLAQLQAEMRAIENEMAMLRRELGARCRDDRLRAEQRAEFDAENAEKLAGFYGMRTKPDFRNTRGKK